jgi:predicted DNA-binding transcriptional regulator AlpA
MAESNFDNSISATLERRKLLRGTAVENITGVGKTQRNKGVKAGTFPPPVKQIGEDGLPGRTNYWTQGDILDYLQTQIDARNKRLAEVATEGLNGWLNRAIGEKGDSATRNPTLRSVVKHATADADSVNSSGAARNERTLSRNGVRTAKADKARSSLPDDWLKPQRKSGESASSSEEMWG